MSSRWIPLARAARIAILLSGRGSNFLALHAAIESEEIPARIVLVVSDRPEALGLERARELGLPALALPPGKGPGRRAVHRAAQEARILQVLEDAKADWICLAGYMRLLSASFIARYRHRIVNIHPSLLPSFPGLDAQRQALDHGVRVAGCTVHLVDEGLDSGPIIEQRAVPILDGDTVEALSARILEQEHRAYPAALARLLAEPWGIEGRRVRFFSAP